MADAMERIQTSGAELQEARILISTLRHDLTGRDADRTAAIEALETQHAAAMRALSAEQAADASAHSQAQAQLQACRLQHSAATNCIYKVLHISKFVCQNIQVRKSAG